MPTLAPGKKLEKITPAKSALEAASHGRQDGEISWLPRTDISSVLQRSGKSGWKVVMTAMPAELKAVVHLAFDLAEITMATGPSADSGLAAQAWNPFSGMYGS